MISRAEFQNFKSLRDVQLSFGRLTVLVGPNASGKTSILAGLNLLKESLNTPVDHWQSLFRRFGGFDVLRSHNAAGPMSIQCEDLSGAVRFTATENSEESSKDGRSERPEDDCTVRLERRDVLNSPDEWNPVEKGWAARSSFGRMMLLRLNGASLANPSHSLEKTPRIESDGAGLASMLAYCKLSQPDAFARIEGFLREVVPAIRAVRFERVPWTLIGSEKVLIGGEVVTKRTQQGTIADAIQFDMESASGVPASSASEGTLLALGIISTLLGPGKPTVLLLDDIDHGLHPRAQRNLVHVIQRILEQSPGIQIIATTHSPYLVDHLRPEEVWLTSLRDDGSTACARLDEHPDFDRWKDEMSPGEFWSSVGETWVSERAPAGAAP